MGIGLDLELYSSPSFSNREFFKDSSKETNAPPADNPLLLNWLTHFNLQTLYDALLIAGYDDVELMAEQMRSHMPITRSKLSKIGVTKPGHQARLIAHLCTEPVDVKTPLRRSLVLHPSEQSIFECCRLPAPDPVFNTFPTLKQWLKGINLG